MSKENIFSTGDEIGFTLTEILVAMCIVFLLSAMLLPTVRKGMESAHAAGCVNNLRQLGLGLVQFASENNGNLPPATEYAIDPTGTVTGITPFSRNPSGWVYQYADPIWPKATRLGVCPADTNKMRNTYYWIYSYNYCFLVSYVNGSPDKNGNEGSLANNGYGRKIKLAEAGKKVLLIDAIDLNEAKSWSNGTPRPSPSANGVGGAFLWNDYLPATITSRHAGRGNSLWGDGSVRSVKFTDLKQTDIERDQP